MTSYRVLFLIAILVLSVHCQNDCVKFSPSSTTVEAKQLSNVSVLISIQRKCASEPTQMIIIAEFKNYKPPYRQICQLIVRSDGSCTENYGCYCWPGGFTITRQVTEPERETWFIKGKDHEFEAETYIHIDVTGMKGIDSTIAYSTATIVIPTNVTENAAMSSAEGIPMLYVIVGVGAGNVVVIIIVAVVFRCRQANTNVSGQVNPRSAEVEMVPIYSRTDPDVHHYLGLPPNRHAPTGDDDDEGGYLEVIDSESRPESNIYQAPREMPSADYLHPVASAQEGPALPERAPGDDQHPMASVILTTFVA